MCLTLQRPESGLAGRRRPSTQWQQRRRAEEGAGLAGYERSDEAGRLTPSPSTLALHGAAEAVSAAAPCQHARGRADVRRGGRAPQPVRPSPSPAATTAPSAATTAAATTQCLEHVGRRCWVDIGRLSESMTVLGLCVCECVTVTGSLTGRCRSVRRRKR